MKNKKGFTLVELLAVIAILAILVIIAIPNVIELYTKAKKKTFVTEIQSLYKMSKNEFILKSNEGNTIKEFSSYGENKLSMTGNKMEYCIELNNNGDVKSIKATNGNYYIDITENEIEDLDIDKIYEGNINNFSCENTIYDYDIEEIDMKPFINSLKELEIRNKPLVLFGSCGWRDTKFIDKWENNMEDYGFNVLGKLAVKDSIEKDDLIKAKELGKLLTLDR